MKREEGGSQEEVVHGVEVDVAQGAEDEHQEEKEEEGDRGEEADFSGEGTGLEVFGHGHADFEAGEEVFVGPGEIPARGGLVFFGGGESVLAEVDGFGVGIDVVYEIL